MSTQINDLVYKDAKTYSSTRFGLHKRRHNRLNLSCQRCPNKRPHGGEGGVEALVHALGKLGLRCAEGGRDNRHAIHRAHNRCNLLISSIDNGIGKSCLKILLINYSEAVVGAGLRAARAAWSSSEREGSTTRHFKHKRAIDSFYGLRIYECSEGETDHRPTQKRHLRFGQAPIRLWYTVRQASKGL